ncbi:MAG: protein kinase [Myxococcota bacterium]|nr:protein kinase [Myxococcota bacterium]
MASGGMATVHFGRLQGAAGFARSVAIKRLHPQYAKDADFVGMFLDEARLAARIAHPNVVPTLDVVAQGEDLLLVMEYVRGSALSRLLRTLTQKGERMPPRIAAAIAAGVLRGLHAAHEAKSETGEALEIVHRDVSPQNVLVGTDGIPRVLDFGVAKAAGRVQTTREGQLKGKLAYMAPEQITTGSVTRKTDVYAAAVVLWEMLTGRRLFRADNEAKLLSLVLDSEVQLPSALVEGLPVGFDRVVERGLDRDPAKRYATAREMAIEVEAVAGIAAQTEVGEWVEIIAADELRERANRIEEIERTQGSSPNAVSHAWPIPGPASGAGRRADEPATVQHRRRNGAPRVESPEPSAKPAQAGHVSQVSQVSQVAVAHTERPQRSKKRSVGLFAAAVLLFGAVGVTLLALRPSHSRADSSNAVAVPKAAARAADVPSATAPTQASAPTPPADPTATHASGTGPASPTAVSLDDLPTAALKPAPRPLPAGGYVPPPQGYIPPATYGPPPKRPGVGAAGDCNPPYTTDAKGHIHFKPACVN